MLTSELVTNAVLHGHGDIHVIVSLSPASMVRVEVHDRDGERLPAAQEVAEDATGGRGLALVAALARHWGVVQGGEGKTVWFELEAKS